MMWEKFVSLFKYLCEVFNVFAVKTTPPNPNEQDPPLGLEGELIKKACALAFKAHKSPKKCYLLKKIVNSSSKVNLIISFPGSWVASDWFVRKPFGVTNINLALFPSLRSLGNDQAALVNEAFLLRFQSILSNSSLKSEVNEAIRKGYQIVFTGHSSGAAMAILATFWALEEYLNPTKNQNHKPPFCVTFGSPLIGNHIFSHASRRENWSRYFIHFVMRFDIVPRILLAPFSSIEQIFSSILQFLNPKFKTSTQDSVRASVVSEFYSTVMRNAATVTNHAACNLMGNTNLLVENVSDFVALSPYRPFGTYIFCNGNGQLIVIRNSDAVLQLMLHTAQPNNLAENSEVAHKSIQEHLVYEAKLRESMEMLNVADLDQLEELPLSPDGSNRDIATVRAALDGLELSTGARLCLQAAGELEKQKNRNEGKIDMKKVQESMKELEEYRSICEMQGKGYYDAFKMQKELRDFRANVKRLELAGVWDEIIEKLISCELPDEFEGKKEWVDLGTRFRQLVEPLDIANYYRHARHYEDDDSSYMVKGRPKRYRYPQIWLEHAERRPQEVNSASCSWAEVEDICYITSKNNSSFEDVKERVEQLEVQIKAWSEKGELAKDVFLEGSTLVNWWKALPPHHKRKSCIRSLIEM
ncbi:EDS1L protein [Spatholobus suberectus]|nr:EDS1L protein [Spatholobus suberectus]